MGGNYRVRREISKSQADRLAFALSRVDSEGKREMQPYTEGRFAPVDFLPYFRRSLRRVLAGDRLKPTVRAELERFATEIGTEIRGEGEPRTRHVGLRLSASQFELFSLAAAAAGVDLSTWLRDAGDMRMFLEGGGAR